MRGDKQIKLAPERSVLGLRVGDRINLTAEQFERLSAAFFDELERVDEIMAQAVQAGGRLLKPARRAL